MSSLEPQQGAGHHLGAPALPGTAGQRCGRLGMCVHKDEECLFFRIDFLRINAGQAERGSTAAVYQVFAIKSLLPRNRWQRDHPQEAPRGASATAGS